MSPRLLIANLDGEIDLARETTPGPHPRLSTAAARLVGAAASHMAHLARPGDRLWLPAPVPPEALSPVARERRLAIETGRLDEAPAAEAVCAWAETGAVARLRPAEPVPSDHDVAARAAGAEWREALWHLRTDPAVAARVNHRGFAFALASSRGWAMPGSRLVADIAELERHLAAGAAEAGGGRWVLKATLSAAGRERMRHAGAELGAGERVRIGRLFARFGSLLLEPWVDRIADLACCGLVHGEGVRLFAPHRLDNDPRGVFRAAVIDDAGPGDERGAVQEAAAAAGQALAAAGYRGPFSVDAYTWRDPTGALRLQPMSEINARLSFGLLARMAAEDAGAPGGPFELRP